MDKKFRVDDVKGDDKKERAYMPEQDILHALAQAAVDVREQADQEIYKEWGIPYKAFSWCNAKIHNDNGEGIKILFSVDRLDNGLRLPSADSIQLEKYGRETQKVLKSYITEFKKVFKQIAGKALTLTKVQEIPCKYEKVANNGLYRFSARQIANVKTKIERQEYPTNMEDSKKMRE